MKYIGSLDENLRGKIPTKSCLPSDTKARRS